MAFLMTLSLFFTVYLSKKTQKKRVAQQKIANDNYGN